MSGAEWWTLVLDEEESDEEKEKEDEEGKQSNNKDNKANDGNSNGKDDKEDEDEGDEVGLHFDADYGLEAQAPGLLLHPRLATVTYLSDFGAPTIVFDCPSPPLGKLESLNGHIGIGWLSHPEIGKHICFDGRLLHGAGPVPLVLPARPRIWSNPPALRPDLPAGGFVAPTVRHLFDAGSSLQFAILSPGGSV